jgi:hypothetical protein
MFKESYKAFGKNAEISAKNKRKKTPRWAVSTLGKTV